MVIAGILVASFAFGSVASGASPGSPSGLTFANTTYTEGVWKTLQDGGSLRDAIAAQGLVNLEEKQAVPQWLEDEVLPASKQHNAFADEGYRVVGFVIAGTQDEAMGILLADLSEKGWVPFGSATAETVSLVKQEGVCRWLMVQCVGLGEETSVVLHIARG